MASPFTSNWEWVSLARNFNTSFGGGVWNEKTPQVVQRFRWSDEAYSSEEGDTSSSLSGENGGVTETISAGTLADVGRFDDSENWVSTSSNWVQSGGHNGKPTYTQTNYSKYDQALVDVIFYATVSDYSTLAYESTNWWCCAVAPSDLGALPTHFLLDDTSGGVGPNLDYYIPRGTNIIIVNGAKTTSTTLDGATFTPTYFSAMAVPDGDSLDRDWSGNSDFDLATRTIDFECIADTQSYPQQGVDWYKQTQTWREIPTGY
tara:strand:+ start:1544 stop:2326 length:783 start_codon:yes stop_codon:yes gene_type:complete